MSKNIACWTLTYPRPIGVAPTVYLVKPNIEPIPCEIKAFINPYSVPTVVEHATILGALKAIIDFNWDCQYLKEIEIKGEGN